LANKFSIFLPLRTQPLRPLIFLLVFQTISTEQMLSVGGRGFAAEV